MRANKLLSIIAVAMLIACPLLSLASDTDSNADVGDFKENGYYFKVSGGSRDLYTLTGGDTGTGYQFISNLAIQCLLDNLTSKARSIFASAPMSQITIKSFDSFTWEAGHYRSVTVGEKVYESYPISVSFKNVVITMKANSSATGVAIINTNGLSNLDGFVEKYLTKDVTAEDVITLKGDVTIESMSYSDRSYVGVNDGYALTKNVSTQPERYLKSANIAARQVNYDMDLSIQYSDEPSIDFNATRNIVPTVNVSTVFTGEEPYSSETVVELMANSATLKITKAVSLTNSKEKCSDKYVKDNSKEVKDSIKETTGSLDELGLIISEDVFESYLASVDEISILELISGFKEADGEEQAIEAIQKLGGKCTVDPSQAKNRCVDLNNRILGISNDDLSTVMLVSIIAVVLISVFAVGVILVGIKGRS